MDFRTTNELLVKFINNYRLARIAQLGESFGLKI